MRYSRLRKNQARKRYATFILIVILGLGLIYVVSAGTLGKYVSNLILPIINGESQSGKQEADLDDPLLTPPNDTEELTEDTSKVNDTLKANALSLYTIQMGAFTEEENAKAFSGELKARGGAGYIYNDGFYRVMAIGFQSEEDANKVKDELIANDMEASIYKLVTSGADMQITATEENGILFVQHMKSGIEVSYAGTNNCDLDSGAITLLEALDRISSINSEMELKKERLQEINANQSNNEILDGLVKLYDNSCLSLERIKSKVLMIWWQFPLK